jgi:ribonuclease HI
LRSADACAKRFIGMAEQPIVVFADGAAKGNPGPGGWGVVIVTPNGHVTELGGGERHTTNNRMELTAVIEALRHLRPTPGPVALYTDSTYVIRGIREWIHGWRRRGWKTAAGGDVLNRDLWESLAALPAARGREGTVAWHYVRGHTGVPGNERVDEIADGWARGQPVSLHNGPLLRYPFAVLDLPEDTRVPERRARATPRNAHSYVSVVDGRPMRHASWVECERRVKGRPGARFKKAMSAADEAAILADWGFAPGDLD